MRRIASPIIGAPDRSVCSLADRQGLSGRRAFAVAARPCPPQGGARCCRTFPTNMRHQYRCRRANACVSIIGLLPSGFRGAWNRGSMHLQTSRGTQLNRLSVPPTLPTSASLFLDFDGTLVSFAPRPQDISVAAWVIPTLQSLRQSREGALAIVSGRPLCAIDVFLHPLVLAAAGCHGVERRSATGLVERHELQPPASVAACARQLAARHAGLVLESKPSGFALHYRLSPELATMCREQLGRPNRPPG